MEREAIAADYSLSAAVRWPEEVEWLENGPGLRADRERTLARWAARPGVMLEIMAQLDARYGGAEGYLRRAGMTRQNIGQVRTRLIGR